MSFYNKYLKYKQKYLELKNQHGGTFTINIMGKCLELLKEIYTDTIIKELKDKVKSFYKEKYPTFVFTDPDIESKEDSKEPHEFYNINSNILFSNKFYVKDPFFEKTIFGNMFEWYNTVNPGFKPMKDNKRSMIEYKTLIATMIKNLICCLLFNKMPVEDISEALKELLPESKTNIESLLTKIETMLNKDTPYLYVDIISIMKAYMLIFESDIYTSKSTNTPEQNKALEEIEAKKQYKCEYEFKIFDILLNSPYIIFPTFYMHNYMKVLLTMKLPLINFYLTNTDHMIHDMMSGICGEIYHDVRGHYYVMNLRIFDKLFTGQETYMYYDLELHDNFLDKITSFNKWKNIIDKINEPANIKIVIAYFQFFNKLITIIQEFKCMSFSTDKYPYDFKAAIPKELYNIMVKQYNHTTEVFKLIIMRCNEFIPLILFYYLHESYKLYSFYNGTINSKNMIEYLTNFYKNIINTIPIICTGNNYYKFLNDKFKLNIPMDSSDSIKTRQIIEVINQQVHKVLKKLQNFLVEKL